VRDRTHFEHARAAHHGGERRERGGTLADGERQELELFLSWTGHEFSFDDSDGRKPSMDLVASLEQKGYEPVTLETGDGPGWGAWRAQNDRILTQFFPRR